MRQYRRSHARRRARRDGRAEVRWMGDEIGDGILYCCTGLLSGGRGTRQNQWIVGRAVRCASPRKESRQYIARLSLSLDVSSPSPLPAGQKSKKRTRSPLTLPASSPTSASSPIDHHPLPARTHAHPTIIIVVHRTAALQSKCPARRITRRCAEPDGQSMPPPATE